MLVCSVRRLFRGANSRRRGRARLAAKMARSRWLERPRTTTRRLALTLVRVSIALKGVEVAFQGLLARVDREGFFLQLAALLPLPFRGDRRNQLALCAVRVLDEVECLPREEHFVHVVLGVILVGIASATESGTFRGRRWRPCARERSAGIGSSRAGLEVTKPRSRESGTRYGRRGHGGGTRRGETRRTFRRYLRSSASNRSRRSCELERLTSLRRWRDDRARSRCARLVRACMRRGCRARMRRGWWRTVGVLRLGRRAGAVHYAASRLPLVPLTSFGAVFAEPGRGGRERDAGTNGRGHLLQGARKPRSLAM